MAGYCHPAIQTSVYLAILKLEAPSNFHHFPLTFATFTNVTVSYYLLFTGNTYPSKPKIDGVGSAKYYEKNVKYISSLQNCDWTRNVMKLWWNCFVCLRSLIKCLIIYDNTEIKDRRHKQRRSHTHQVALGVEVPIDYCPLQFNTLRTCKVIHTTFCLLW